MTDESNHTTLEDFFTHCPPGEQRTVSCGITDYPAVSSTQFRAPAELFLHCSNGLCNRDMLFHRESNSWDPVSTEREGEIRPPTPMLRAFRCNHCEKTRKTYAFMASLDYENKCVMLLKLGEDPAFGTPLPPRIHKLLGPSGDTFFKGYRSENQGLGIGAFAYYRRVVEDQKDRLIDTVARVAESTGGFDDLLKDLERAKNETQFSRAIKQIKHTLPEALRINGHDPLSLLHNALSDGIHALSDTECLERAQAIREVLAFYAERLDRVTKDEEALKGSLGTLLKVPAKGKRKKTLKQFERPAE